GIATISGRASRAKPRAPVERGREETAAGGASAERFIAAAMVAYPSPPDNGRTRGVGAGAAPCYAHSAMPKRRADALLVERGLAESREKARAAILAGEELAAGRPVAKPGLLLDDAVTLEVTAAPRFVSRGGDKLDHALTTFGIDPAGLAVLDAGASTGGFTDCLLQRGAARVYAVDVGYGVIDYRLRGDPRVRLIERTNLRYLDALPEPVDLATLDLSFISLRLVL